MKDLMDRRAELRARRIKSRGKELRGVKREPPAIFSTAIGLPSFVSSFVIFLINYIGIDWLPIWLSWPRATKMMARWI